MPHAKIELATGAAQLSTAQAGPDGAQVGEIEPGGRTSAPTARRSRVETQQLSLTAIMLLHFLPGVLALVFYVVVAPLLVQSGVPAVVAMLLAAVLIIVPFELGLVLRESRRSTGTFSIRGSVPYLARLTLRDYLLWVPGVFLASLLLPGLVAWLAPLIRDTLFSWLPEWFLLYNPAQYTSQPGSGVVAITIASLVVLGLLGPIAEEIYFRGYLLPRMSRFGAWAPFSNALLFALYHLWQPYSVLTVAAAFLPVAYAVWWKRSIYLGIVAHCAVNFVTLSLFFVPLISL